MQSKIRQLIYVFFTLAMTNVSADDYLSRNNVWKVASRISGIPPFVIYGIAKQESGVEKNGVRRPHPWTLNINGPNPKSMRFASRHEAEQTLVDLLSQGIKNIDIGLMQVNLKYHGHSVSHPTELLDPKVNVIVASVYLGELFKRTGNLDQTVARYHSGDPDRGKKYKDAVFDRILSDWSAL